MTTIAEDIITMLEGAGLGQRHVTLFTPADARAYEARPLTCIVTEARSSQDSDVTVQADRSVINLVFAGQYDQRGQTKVYDLAHSIYIYLRNGGQAPFCLLDKVVNGHTYLCIKAQHPPSHDGIDPDGRTIYSFEVEIYRVLEE